ncbi:hypothetical protein V7x_43540 [Crateriforma conspicua]|uniref:Uncharacterized protein n=2 Tax=Crateriforma conspicua TaxID=2527996 RepID=A0A5C6FMC0_9PLAN|nr:hypothetical protein V7x_43540 [Crateriforma conspicua]
MEQIEDFSSFAKSRLGSDDSVSIDELYSQWRSQAFKDVDQMAVAASVRDLEAGERGQELGEFLADFDKERGKK